MKTGSLFYKTCVLLAFTFCLGSTTMMAQTELLISYLDGTEESFSVDESGKIYFEEKNLLIDDGALLPTSIPIADIRKITIPNNNPSAGVSYAKTTTDGILLYPNPTQNFIRITDSKNDFITIQLYSMNGQLLMQGDFTSGEQISVAHLPKGLYIVKVNNRTLKFSKI